MISPNVTPAVARALDFAQRLAHASGAASLESRHVLRGLLLEEEGKPAQLLGGAGLCPIQVRAWSTQAVEPPTMVDPEAVPIPWSIATERIMDHARELARELAGERTLASEHVLLAILRMDQGLRTELIAQGLRFVDLETALLGPSTEPLELEEPLRLPESVERMATARILDASANRAREALRVIEDYCRFVLDDRFLSGQSKQLRHDLQEALCAVPGQALLSARETLRDVGTTLTTSSEQVRYSLVEVVQANCKRLQEALRSLEEYSKLEFPQVALAVERLRYRSYTLDRSIMLGSTARARLADARLYLLVTGATCKASLDWTIEEAIAGGANIVQLREKLLPDRELLERARRVRRITRKFGALFIMNDRPDLARLADADGVHIGQEELPIKDVRQIVGSDALVGVSTHTLEQVRQAVLDGASYLGLGPIFPSGTKDFAHFPGLDFIREALTETTLPAFAIGGINLETVKSVAAVGARRIAVSLAICQSDDPQTTARQLYQALPG